MQVTGVSPQGVPSELDSENLSFAVSDHLEWPYGQSSPFQFAKVQMEGLKSQMSKYDIKQNNNFPKPTTQSKPTPGTFGPRMCKVAILVASSLHHGRLWAQNSGVGFAYGVDSG